MSKTELINPTNYDTSRMIFSDPTVGSIPNSKPAISFRRINISTLNDDGSTGELIIPTEEVYSFGVQENTDIETGKTNGYIMALCLHNKNGATEYEKSFSSTFNAIVEKCKDHLMDHKDDIEQYELERNDLKKLNPLYYKKEKGKVVEGAGPTLYAKLIVSKKQDKILTVFFDMDSDETVQALDLLGKYCFARAAIKIESIFIGNKISLQVKLYECGVRVINFGMKRLLPRPEADSKVTATPSTLRQITKVAQTQSKVVEPVVDDNEDDDVGSLVNADDDDDDIPAEETIKPVPKKTITTVKKTVAKKVVKA